MNARKRWNDGKWKIVERICGRITATARNNNPKYLYERMRNDNNTNNHTKIVATRKPV